MVVFFVMGEKLLFREKQRDGEAQSAIRAAIGFVGVADETPCWANPEIAPTMKTRLR